MAREREREERKTFDQKYLTLTLWYRTTSTQFTKVLNGLRGLLKGVGEQPNFGCRCRVENVTNVPWGVQFQQFLETEVALGSHALGPGTSCGQADEQMNVAISNSAQHVNVTGA